MILLTPGPANTTETVKQALAVPDICHREPEFTAITRSIREDLVKLANGVETHEVILLTGSGTCAVDAAISSCVPDDGKLLVIVNGSYGVRIVQMAEIYGIPFEAMELPWHERPDPAAVAQTLDHGAFTHVALIHHETSTGILNPIQEIAEICRARGAVVILDAISSFAGIPLDLAATPVDVMMVSANKCLQGMPGISFVFVRYDLLAQVVLNRPRSYYTGLAQEFAAVRKTGQMRFTPAVQVLYALRRALDETLDETLEGRFARYRANWEALVKGMLAQGFKKLLSDEHESGLLTSFLKPEQEAYDFDRHHDLLYEAGYTIYPAMVGYQHTFRLGNIGQITTEHIDGFLAANAEVLKSMGVAKPFYSS